MLQFSKTCLLLVTFLLGFTFPAWSESYPDGKPQVVVSVYDDAGVTATVLTEAERKAARIFQEAGVQVIWAYCPTNHVGPDTLVRAGERSSPGSNYENAGLRPAGRVGAPAPTWSAFDCARFKWPTHLAVRIVPQSASSTHEVLGVAFLSAEGTGCYSDVFYDRATELHTDWKIGLSDLLGDVMAHELGHLLLGSNSHSPTGIMRAHWQGEELHRLSRGNLWFTDEQADRMRAKLNGVRPTVALAARSGF